MMFNLSFMEHKMKVHMMVIIMCGVDVAMSWKSVFISMLLVLTKSRLISYHFNNHRLGSCMIIRLGICTDNSYC